MSSESLRHSEVYAEAATKARRGPASNLYMTRTAAGISGSSIGPTSRRGLSSPLPAAKLVPRFCAAGSEGATKYLSMIGICKRFILGVMTTMWFVLISIQSAASKVLSATAPKWCPIDVLTFFKGQRLTCDL